MPNESHDLTPRYEDEIKAEVIDAVVAEVSSKGWAEPGVTEYAHHLVAWAPFEDGGQISTTTYNQNRKEHVQSYVQKDGNVNVGTEEHSGRKLLLLILDEKLEQS